MPCSLEAEESLLGNIILYEDAIRECAEAGITSEDFYLDKNRKIYSIMLAMHENRENIDTTSLMSKLRDYDCLDKIGGLDYLLRLTDSTIYRGYTKDYIRIIKDKSLQRQIIKAGEDIANDAYDGK